MPNFRYRALKNDGTVVEATGEAVSRTEFLAWLKGQGLVVTQLESIVSKNWRRARTPRGLINRFYVMLGNQLQVGVPILSAIRVIEEQEQSLASKALLNDLAQSIESGSTLYAALDKHGQLFSTVDLNLIRAGEEGGFLPDAIERIAFIREWQQKLISGAWGAAAYPLVLISLALILVPAMLLFLVPKLEPIFASLRRDASLPLATSLLLSLSSLTAKYGAYALVGVILSVVAVMALVPKDRLRLVRDRIILQMPVIGELVRDFILARFFRILGTLLQNKIQILNSLNIAINVLGNQELVREFRMLPETVATGKRLAETLKKTGRVPNDIVAMIGVAEQSNSLDSVLSKIAEQLEFKTNRRMEIAVKLVEPLLLLLMAGFVGFVVLALLMPIFEGQSLN